MALTAFIAPTHVLPEEIQMPALNDPVGGGEVSLRRLYPRALRRWELTIPATHEKLDPFTGFLELVQGDVPFWFDGAGMIEVVEPIPIAVANGTDTEFTLPHRHVYVSSTVIYANAAILTTWTPIGDGITMDSFVCTVAPDANSLLTAKYKRKAMVILETDQPTQRQRMFRNQTNETGTLFSTRIVLSEVAND
jgi:hypothetical protein